MKNKKIGVIFLVILIMVLIGGYLGIQYVKKKEKETMVQEYIPQEEIAEEQVRQTIVSLYFPEKETNELNPEARLIDIKEIINNPYEKLIHLLIENDCVVLDFSAEFLSYTKENSQEKTNIIESIVNTLTELREINKVKILIDGNENSEFNEVYSRTN